MSSSSLSLDPNVRANLRALNLIETLMEKTEERNNSGYKINSAIDDPSAYFMSKSLSNRANMLNSLMDSVTLAVNTVDSAGSAVTSLQKLLDLSKSYANDALDVSNETLTIISNKSFSRRR
jgi:flagellin-like hook-associated protein FlgL